MPPKTRKVGQFQETTIHKDGKRTWEKKYEGFESLHDLVNDIFWAIEHEEITPSGEFEGTLTVQLTYEEVQDEL